MIEKAKIIFPDGQTIDLPVLTGSENEKGIDISSLRKQTGYITLDPGFVNTVPVRVQLLFWMERKAFCNLEVIPLRSWQKSLLLSKLHTC